MSNPEKGISSSDHVGDATAGDELYERLAEVTRLAEKLDESLHEAGARMGTSSKEHPEEVTGSAAVIEEICESEGKIFRDVDGEGSCAEDYMTATECTTTPMARSRSESFATMSEGDDGLAAHGAEIGNARHDAVEGLRSKREAASTNSITVPSVAKADQDKTVVSGSSKMAERKDNFIIDSAAPVAEIDNARQEAIEGLHGTGEALSTNRITVPSVAEADQNKTIVSGSFKMAEKRENFVTDPDIERTSATSVIKRVEEKSGKIVKEVTETTTLRVSHDTRFGVASYKLTTNTLREGRDHTDLRGILDAEGFGIKTNGCQIGNENFARKDEFSKYNREELSHSGACAVPEELPTDHHLNSIKMIRESSQMENRTSKIFNDTSSVAKIISAGSEIRKNNASDVETPPRKSGDLSEKDAEPEDSELLRKMKTSGEWLRLKVLEVRPELTRLGATVDEATRLSTAHDEVLVRLQSKQSPVEELLKQADQLISTQRPRAEVYAAMAETLGQAWRDVNSLLELRKQILDHNVLFQCRAEECRTATRALESACNDTLLPIEIEAVKKFLSKIHDLRKSMLSALMGALQEGKALLDRLKEIAGEGTLDSRPDRIKPDAEYAVLQVEKWLEELHDHRRLIEISFSSRKTQLEQCLALALLATDLRDLEEILTDRIAALASSSDQLGDSSSSAELLLFELKKLQTEAKEFQDRSIKITKSTERLVTSGHFAGEQATEQAYAILETAADYVNDLDQYESILSRAISFFESARSAFTKLDQLEIQLATTEHPEHTAELARFHAQAASTLTDVTASPLSEGYALLDITGRGAPGAEGVKRTVEELENRKIRLMERCTAHKEENLRISRGLAAFFEKYDELRSWLDGIADAFLRGHQDMGSDLPMAKDFHRIHCQLLDDLGKRGIEIDEALAVLSGTILEISDERQRASQKQEVEERVESLRDSWLDSRNSVECRVKLGSHYVEFHEAAANLGTEVDSLEVEFKKNSENLDNERIEELEKRWNDLQPLYVKLTNSGAKFLAEADRSTDAYLDVPRARLCVQTILERFANRQLTVSESWENWQTTIITTRERKIEQERRVEESTRTLEWVSKFGEQLYPILTSDSTNPSTLLQDLESSLIGILPELKKAVTELDARIKSVDSFSRTGEDRTSERIRGQLSRVYDHLRTTASDYQILLESLISVFRGLAEVEQSIDEVKHIRQELERSAASGFLTESARRDMRSKSEKHETVRHSIAETLRSLQTEIEHVVIRIEKQEPPEAAKEEIGRLKRALAHTAAEWESSWQETRTRLDGGIRYCDFADDLDLIDADLRQLAIQLEDSGSRFTGDSLPSAESASQAFLQFEKTIMTLEERITTFVMTTEENVLLSSPDSPLTIHRELSGLTDRWRQLKQLSEQTRKRIDLSVEYFQLLEEAKNWYRDGNKLLIVIARKTTAAKVPEEAVVLLRDVEDYLKPGEELQERRIEKIRDLSTRIFGTDRLPQFNDVVVENRETLDSFAVITSELRTLVQNLESSAIELEEKLREKQREEEELRKLEIAKAEARAAYEAEIAKAAERAAAEAEIAKAQARAAYEAEMAKAAERAAHEAEMARAAERAAYEAEMAKAAERAAHEAAMARAAERAAHEAEMARAAERAAHEAELARVAERAAHEAEMARAAERAAHEAEMARAAERAAHEAELAKVAERAAHEAEMARAAERAAHEAEMARAAERAAHEAEMTRAAERAAHEAEMARAAEQAAHEADMARAAERAAYDAEIARAAERAAHEAEMAKAAERAAQEAEMARIAERAAHEADMARIAERAAHEAEMIRAAERAAHEADMARAAERAAYDAEMARAAERAAYDAEMARAAERAAYEAEAVRAAERAAHEAEMTRAAERAAYETEAARAAERAAHEAEMTRKVAESIVQEEPQKSSVSCTSITERKEERVVEEMISSAITRKEIHILQKTEVEEEVPILMAPLALTEKAQEIVGSPKNVQPERREEVSESGEPPRFVVPLNDATVEEGARLTFACRIHANPEPEVVWYKDGISILNNPDYQTTFDALTGSCTLTIEETFAEDSANFTCKAFNYLGLAETSAILTVKETAPEHQLSPPIFVKELLASRAKKGASHRLECTVTGNPLPTVQWYKNETNIDDSPDYAITYNNGEAILTFLEIFAEDRADYTCKATNRLGQASTTASLDVEVMVSEEKPPEFVVPVVLENGISSITPERKIDSEILETFISKRSETIQEKIIRESKLVTIETCSETMGGRTSQVLPDVSTEEIKTPVEELKIPMKIEENAEASVKEFRDEKPVQEPVEPSVQLQLKNTQVFEGRTARLDCVIIGQPEPEVIWYHDDQPVKESADIQLLFQGDRCSLVIHEAFLDDAGKYKVVAINSRGEAFSECVLSVVPASDSADQLAAGNAPQFVRLMTDALVDEGEDTTFECQVNGEPRPVLRWFFNNVEIDVLNERIKITHDETGTCSLTISSTTLEDKGNYVAKATNLHGEAKAIARLVVKPISSANQSMTMCMQMLKKLVPPTFEEVFADTKIGQGAFTKFECIVHGKPTPKIQWLFNERPVHGKGFLLSVSGERQVLTIPEAGPEHAGTISCVAENTAGKSTCTAKLEISEGTSEAGAVLGKELVPIDTDMHPSSSSEKHFTTERKTIPGGGVTDGSEFLTKMSSSITQSSSSHTSCVKEYKSSTTSSLIEPGRPGRPCSPGSVLTKTTIESSEVSSQRNGAPPVVQSHKIEEFERIIQDTPGEIRQEKTVVVTEGRCPTKVQKPTRKPTAPRFVSPITGMIVDQDSDVVLEGVVDGFPQPTISWSKNGQQLKDNVKTSYAHNHVRLELKNINVKDAGRYTCTAINDAGNASSTADLVVKKTVFPPVFGKRLQAQVVKRGERVVMEVEVTGTPEPTVTWYKDDVPLRERPPEIRIRQLGNCYLLVIEKAEKENAGKYMVNATNAGGEAQSIADFAVFEPTPDTMVEVHKTIVYENVQDKNIVQPDGKKGEIPSAGMTAEHIATTVIQPSSTLKTIPPPISNSSDSIRTIQLIENKVDGGRAGGPIVEKASRSEYISSTTESHQTETKSEQKFHMKLQHKSAPLFGDEAAADSGPKITMTTTTKTSTQETKVGDEPASTKTSEFIETKRTEAPNKATDDSMTIEENENVETSTIAKKDALSFFESMSKDSESTPRGPKAMIKLTQETEDGNYDVKVDKLTKNYERSTRFEEMKKPERSPVETSKRASQDVFEKLERGGTGNRGLDNTMIEFPYEDFKLAPLEMTRTILEDTTASGSPIHGTLTISRLQAQSESAEAMLTGFNLVPEPPPEIGYMPKPDEETPRKRPDPISVKAKQLQESHKHPVDAPIGGVKIFPTPAPKDPISAAPLKEPPRPKPTSIPPPFELSSTDAYECRKEVCEPVCVKKDTQQDKKPDVAADKWWSSTSDLETRSHISTDLSEYRCHSAASSSQIDGRPSSPKPSADGIAMEKSWAKKASADTNRKSWPPQAAKESTKTFSKREEWQEPALGYKTSSRESRQEVEESPGGGVKKTSVQSETTLETRSWSTREDRVEEKTIEKPASPPPPKPVIMYNAETIKVDHTVNPVQEKSVVEKYKTECDVHRTETTEKMIYEELRAPGLVKSAAPPVKRPVVQLYHAADAGPAPEPPRSYNTEPCIFKGTLATAPKRPVVQMYHPAPEVPKEPEVVLEPGPPPEIGYVPPPMAREKKTERYERMEMSMDQSKISPSTIRTTVSRKREEFVSAPPIPPKDARATPPPIPAKNLESCPFQPAAPQTPCQRSNLATAPTPTKFTKGTFVESDYESDFECRSKWRPYESDNEEPRYRRVQAPTPRQSSRPKSTDPEPLPPSSFEVPAPELTGPPRPVVSRDYVDESSGGAMTTSTKKTSSSMMTRHERNVKQQQQQYQSCSQSYSQTEQSLPKPGSPPIYVQPVKPAMAPRSPPAKTAKPESPKFKTRTFQQESGYMADTDEPLHQQRGANICQRSFGKHEGSTTSSTSHSESRTAFTESRSQYMESQSYSSSNQRKETFGSSSAFASTQTPAPKSQIQRSSYTEKSYATTATPGTATCCPVRSKPAKQETFYSMSQSSTQRSAETKKVPPAPSPSRFARGEFRESDYESDYEGRIPPLWKPRGGSDVEDYSFKPVKPNLVNTGKPVRPAAAPVAVPAVPAAPVELKTPRSSTDASVFETKSLQESSADRFVKSDKKKTTTPVRLVPEIPKPTPVRQKSVLLPGSPPELAYAPPRPQSYYEGRSGMPYHNAVGTEMKKTVRMDESTENSRRIVTVEQTSRVIKFGENRTSSQDQQQQQQHQQQQHQFQQSQHQQRQASRFNVPKPKKFVQGQFRESDYESDADVGRIRPKWAPADSDTEDPQYRKVQPPRFPRSSSQPPPSDSGERVATPMEFDAGPPAMSSHSTSFEQHLRYLNEESERLRRSQEIKKRHDSLPEPGTPPQFGYVSTSNVKKAANHVASKHMTDMTSSFKTKTEKFVNDLQSDLKQSKPILKHPPVETRSNETDEPQAYREESRVAQYGTKHIDPDTGLIYFKYDFGYEFGIILPGEGKRTVASSSKSVSGQRRASDIDVPIVHEFTGRRENGFAKQSPAWQQQQQQSSRNVPTKSANGPSKFTTQSKSVKWEPTSESEFSEAEDSTRKRAKKSGNLMPPPPCLVIPRSPTSPKWDPTTPSPMSLSPSLPSFSPRHSSVTGPHSNVDSAAESPWPSSNGVVHSKEIIQPYLDIQPKKAPLFITPLRDIAVVMGQTARFECIVQAEPQPNIIWSRNGRIIENSEDYEIHYRNGVCRLVIPRAYDDDAGTWVCTATNALGSSGTSALLQISGNRRSMYSLHK